MSPAAIRIASSSSSAVEAVGEGSADGVADADSATWAADGSPELPGVGVGLEHATTSAQTAVERIGRLTAAIIA
jgi:hypothetical protein